MAIIVLPEENGRLLDIGCGNGAFLDLMRTYGWRTYGTEISKDAAERARELDLEVFGGELKDANYPSKYFDVIVINQVLEHVHSPKEILLECNRIIKKDGVLIIGVPNFDCFDGRLFKGNWSSLQIPRHLYHFTPHSLKMYLKSTGFEIERIKYDSIFKQYLPGYIKTNVKYFLYHNQENIRKNKKTAILFNTFKILIQMFLCKPFMFLFSKDRSKFCMNITVYASKLN